MIDFPMILNKKEISSTAIWEVYKKCYSRDKTVNYIVEQTGCSLDEANEAFEELLEIARPSRKQPEIKPTTKSKATDSINNVVCPKCGSSFITTGQRGWKWTTGFLGSSKTVNRCGACGHMWKPKLYR